MNFPLRIAICEDIADDAARLIKLIEESGVSTQVSLFESGEVFLAASPSGRFHLLFMDIYMGDLTGAETARKFRETDERCQIVFTTTSEDHATDGYSVDAMQYLVKHDKGKSGLKRLTPENITNVLHKVVRLLEKTAAQVCSIIVDGQRRDVPLRDILYADVLDKRCHLHIRGEAGTETLITVMTIDELAAMLPPPRFLRCHRSNIVNLEHVVKIERDFIMRNGDTVYIRRGDLAKCRQYEKALDEWRLSEAGRDED